MQLGSDLPSQSKLLFAMVHDMSQEMIVDGLQNGETTQENKSNDMVNDAEFTDLEQKEQELLDQIKQIYQQKLVLRQQQRIKLSEKYNASQLEQYQTNHISPFTTQLSKHMKQLQITLNQTIKSSQTQPTIQNETKTEYEDEDEDEKKDKDDPTDNISLIDINNEDVILQLLTTDATTSNPSTQNAAPNHNAPVPMSMPGIYSCRTRNYLC